MTDLEIRQLMRQPEFREQIKHLSLTDYEAAIVKRIEGGVHYVSYLARSFDCSRSNMRERLKRLVGKGYLIATEEVSEKKCVMHKFEANRHE